MTGLRRTALTRRTELARGRELRRRTQLQRVTAAKRTVRKQQKRKDTGPTAATKTLLWDRAGGRCELCGQHLTPGAPFSRHHRRARGSGGSSVPWINNVSNLLLLCGSATSPDGCHRLVETQRQLAYANGWAISLTSKSLPSEVSVDLYAYPTPMYLTSTGEYLTAN